MSTKRNSVAPAQKRAAIYVRVSSDEQAAHGTSIESQRERGIAEVERRGWTLADEYIDAGVSGTKERRPQLDRLMRDCREGKVDVVIIKSLDRLARRSYIGFNLHHELEELGVGLVLWENNLDTTTKEGEMMMTMLLGFATMDHRAITEKMRNGRDQRAKQGLHAVGRAPFGFTVEPNPDGQGKRLVHAPREVEVVTTAARLLLDDGLTVGPAARKLNALGLRPRPRQGIEGGDPFYGWTWYTLRRMLSGRHLIGEGKPYRLADGTELPRPLDPILDAETFERLQLVLTIRKNLQPKERQWYPLSGLVYGRCGRKYTFTIRNDRGYVVGQCSGRKKDSHHCDDRQIRMTDLEGAVVGKILNTLVDPTLLRSLAEDYVLNAPSGENPPSLDDLRRKLEKATTNAAKIRVTGLAAGMTAQEIREAASIAEGDVDAIQSEIDRIAALAIDDEEVDKVSALVQSARQRLENLPSDDLRVLLKLLQVRVDVVDHDRTPTLSIEARVPLGALTASLTNTTPAPAHLRLESP